MSKNTDTLKLSSLSINTFKRRNSQIYHICKLTVYGGTTLGKPGASLWTSCSQQAELLNVASWNNPPIVNVKCITLDTNERCKHSMWIQSWRCSTFFTRVFIELKLLQKTVFESVWLDSVQWLDHDSNYCKWSGLEYNKCKVIVSGSTVLNFNLFKIINSFLFLSMFKCGLWHVS